MTATGRKQSFFRKREAIRYLNFYDLFFPAFADRRMRLGIFYILFKRGVWIWHKNNFTAYEARRAFSHFTKTAVF